MVVLRHELGLCLKDKISLEILEASVKGLTDEIRQFAKNHENQGKSRDLRSIPGWIEWPEKEGELELVIDTKQRISQGGVKDVYKAHLLSIKKQKNLSRYKITWSPGVVARCFLVSNKKSIITAISIHQMISIGFPEAEIVTPPKVRLPKELQHQRDADLLEMKQSWCNGDLFDALITGQIPLNFLKDTETVPFLDQHPIKSKIQLCNMLMGVARALAFIHEIGAIHGDLRAENIFLQLGLDGVVRAKIADFDFVSIFPYSALGARGSSNRQYKDLICCKVDGFFLQSADCRSLEIIICALILPKFMSGLLKSRCLDQVDCVEQKLTSFFWKTANDLLKEYPFHSSSLSINIDEIPENLRHITYLRTLINHPKFDQDDALKVFFKQYEFAKLFCDHMIESVKSRHSLAQYIESNKEVLEALRSENIEMRCAVEKKLKDRYPTAKTIYELLLKARSILE